MADAGTQRSPSRKRKAPSESPDKRLARKVSKPSKAVQDRIDRAFNHRLYLLGREPVKDEGGGFLSCTFHVLGNTGNAYKVTIAQTPTCTCPDAMKGNICKHKLFVLLRVLKCERDNPIVWQRALVSTELQEVLGNSSTAAAEADVLADASARSAYARMTSQIGEDAGSGEGEVKRRELEGDCPICYESLTGRNEATVFCRTCGKNVHTDCFNRWKASKGSSVTCVWCRSPWEAPTAAQNGLAGSAQYVNLSEFSHQHREDPEPSLETVYPESYMWLENRGGRRRKAARRRWRY